MGLSALTGPSDVAKAKADIAAAGSKGEPVMVLVPTDFPTLNAMALVGADMLKRCGLAVDVVATDWGLSCRVAQGAGRGRLERVLHQLHRARREHARHPSRPARQRRGRLVRLGDGAEARGAARRLVRGAGCRGPEGDRRPDPGSGVQRRP
ncbi:hypothetical protein D3273_21980 [Lichenibacterium minor]|uniref:Uncharacterized protein n=1 Tax=Lichenibacterium minor TaxID=2316528 RepID=A0A4Q2U144_9HYPH|nr:hypothetical protein D3273_21980 [Lichenibacterium minor]